MSMTIAYHPSDLLPFRSCSTRFIIHRTVILLCLYSVYFSHCPLVQSKLVNPRKLQMDVPMVIETQTRFPPPAQHIIVDNHNKPRMCFNSPATVKKSSRTLSPSSPSSTSTPPPPPPLAPSSSTSSSWPPLSVILSSKSLSLPGSSSSSSSLTNYQSQSMTSPYVSSLLPTLYPYSITATTKLPYHSSNISPILYLNSTSSSYLSSSSSSAVKTLKGHKRRHEKHRKHREQQRQRKQQQQQYNNANNNNHQSKSKCHSIKVHASRQIYLKPLCSRHYLYMRDKTVRAAKATHLIDNVFIMTGMAIRGKKSHGSLVSFQGLKSAKFICFNKQGKIVAKCHSIKVHASRQIYLKPLCSRHYLYMRDKTVRAAKATHLIDNVFIMTGMAIRGKKSHGSLVSFQGLKSAKFICFNKQGKIVAKENGQWDLSCLFREVVAIGPAFKFQSFYNNNWYLGFDTKGRPIRGTINSHERRKTGTKKHSQHCYEFSKIKIV